MKGKNILYSIILVIIVLTVFISSFLLGNTSAKANNNDKDIYTIAKEESTTVLDSEKKPFTKIGVNEYINIYNLSDESLVLVGRSGCEYCTIAEPLIQYLMYKYDLNIYYLSTDDFTVETEEKFMSSNDVLSSFSTPLLMIVSNGNIKDYIDELKDINGYSKFLSKNNIINLEE